MSSGNLQSLVREFDATLPLERARTIPNTWYTSPELADLERAAVFGESWQIVGRSEQLVTPGAFITTRIAGEPVAVVRGEDGVLRGFINICRHKAATVLAEPCGIATKLRCRYHGWTYDLSGKLRGTPEFDGVEEFRREDNGLRPVAVAEWGSLVWAQLSEPRVPVEEYLRPFGSWVQSRGGLGNLTWKARKEYDLACNWKVYVDNYLDGGYHVNTVHPGLAGVLDYREYRTVCEGNTVVQSSPMKPAEGETGRTRTGTEAAYWWVYPNFMLNLYSGVMDTNLVVPLGVDRCRVIFDFYFAAGTDESFIQDSLNVADQVQDEDMGVCEDVQRNLNTRSYSTGRFSVKRENGGYYFHQLLARALQSQV